VLSDDPALAPARGALLALAEGGGGPGGP
jgi:hypothetical protein